MRQLVWICLTFRETAMSFTKMQDWFPGLLTKYTAKHLTEPFETTR